MERYYDDKLELQALIGTPVTIVRCTTKKYEQYELVSRSGRIVNHRTIGSGGLYTVKSLAVEIVGLRNPASNTGVFWFDPEDLEPSYKFKNERNKTMAKYVLKLRNPAQNATVRHTFAEALEPYEVGDMVVVDYRYPNEALSVRYVEEVILDVNYDGDAIVRGRVDTKTYDDHAQKKRVEIMDRLRRRAANCQEEVLWRAMALYDPEMEKLLEELKGCK